MARVSLPREEVQPDGRRKMAATESRKRAARRSQSGVRVHRTVFVLQLAKLGAFKITAVDSAMT
jgi:hypothetical protein